jgi:hypothetical protein
MLLLKKILKKVSLLKINLYICTTSTIIKTLLKRDNETSVEVGGFIPFNI